jgi:hypothetical protein
MVVIKMTSIKNKDRILSGLYLLTLLSIVVGGYYLYPTQDDIYSADIELATSTEGSFVRYVQADSLNDSFAVAYTEGLVRQEQIISVEWSDNENWTVVYSMRR